MRKVVFYAAIVATGLGLVLDIGAAPTLSRSDIPNHYKPISGDCRAGRGYTFVAEALGYPSTYPKLLLRVFNGEIIGLVFEADAASGWKPWYDQPEGKPISHGGGPVHYSHAINLKRAPTAEECASSRGSWEKGEAG